VWREDTKAQSGGRDTLEVGRVGEEGEHTSSRGGGRFMDVSKTCVDTLLIVVGVVAPPTAGRFRRLYATLLTLISALPLATIACDL
jgi:hypothetical protein